MTDHTHPGQLPAARLATDPVPGESEFGPGMRTTLRVMDEIIEAMRYPAGGLDPRVCGPPNPASHTGYQR